MNTRRVKLIAFPLGFVLLWVILQQALLHGIRRYETGNLGVLGKVMSGKVGARILFCGSSRTWVHFDPTIIKACTGKPAFNIGRDGTLPDVQLAFLKAYLRHNAKPDVLVQGLDITMLRRTVHVYHPSQYIAYLDDPDLYEALSTIDPVFRLYKQLPLIGIVRTGGIRNGLQGLTGRWKKEDHESGYARHDIAWRKDFDEFKAIHSSGVTVEINESAVLAVRGILGLCRDKGIPVILVYSPEYIENQVLTTNRAEVLKIFREMAADYGIPLWDYSNHPLCSQKRYFYNSQHMNGDGATLFSEDCGKRLMEYLAGAGRQGRLGGGRG